jgi:twitching motility protein PilT
VNAQLVTLLSECIRHGASDLHLSSDETPYLRVNGDLAKATVDALPRQALEEIVISLLNEGQRANLERSGAADVAFSLNGNERFRGHIYREKRGLSLAIRRLEEGFRTLAELNLPPALAELSRLTDGLVLFTGPTGSGKSTTLATLIDDINRNRACHIMTIEDPIEYLHQNRRSLVHQREIQRDVVGFAEAVRASLREDPDVVLVGEMRDLETMRAAIVVAETGHLVFSTLHCGSAVGALDRIIGAFPAHERGSLCQQLSMTLRVVVAQHLLPRAGGRGRVPAVEVLRINRAVANLIRNYKSEQIYTVMEGGGEQGMQTLEQSLAGLVTAGNISAETARSAAANVPILDQRLKAADRGAANGSGNGGR